MAAIVLDAAREKRDVRWLYPCDETMSCVRVGIRVLLACVLIARGGSAQSIDTTTVVIHGHRIQLLTSGGPGPTVVFEAGFATSQRTWSTLRPLVDPSVRMVTYDRPGLGASEICPDVRDALTIAKELRLMLRAAKIPPPYLLVGWSAGALHTRVFAGLYPNEVRGLLLIDPSPDTFYGIAEREYPEVYRRLSAADSVAPSSSAGERAEDAGWLASLGQAQKSDASWHGPLVVLSAAREDLDVLEPIWHREQRAWTARRQGTYALVAQAGHAIHRDRPDSVATVLSAFIRQTHSAR
ncbi:MAG: alpha/beta hydrolase [Gemmatimonadetes bacterium]|nr:alpha/beta hydrolase [Gemmatimonadota bacterium]